MKIERLNNGLTVITEHDPNSKTVTISYTVKCGSYNEERENLGIAHFTEHMLFKGTTKMTSKEISEAIEGIGGIMNAETNFEYTRYYCTIPKEFWKTGYDVLTDMIFFNTIPEDEFDRERQVILEELQMYEDDPGSKIFDLLFQHMHPSYFNRQLIGGTIETVSEITRDQMMDFIDKFYVPSNMIVIVTGNINQKELFKTINETYNNIEIGVKNEIEKQDFVPDKLNSDFTATKQIYQSHLCWGLFGPKSSEPDYMTSEVVVNILGGNSSSRLYQIIREQRGLAYTVDMSIAALSEVSIITGYVGLNGSKIEEVKKIVREELQKVKNVTEAELDRTKTYLKGVTIISLETTKGKNTYINNSIISNLNLDVEEYLNAIDNVTIDDINKFVDKYFKDDNLCFVKLIPQQN